MLTYALDIATTSKYSSRAHNNHIFLSVWCTYVLYILFEVSCCFARNFYEADLFVLTQALAIMACACSDCFSIARGIPYQAHHTLISCPCSAQRNVIAIKNEYRLCKNVLLLLPDVTSSPPPKHPLESDSSVIACIICPGLLFPVVKCHTCLGQKLY